MVRSRVVGRGFEVDGAPFFYNGIQFSWPRLARRDGWSHADLDQIVGAAAASGFTVLGVPVQWGTIEPEPGVFDWSDVEWIVASAREHGLKIEVLWFGSQVCSVSTPSHGTPEWAIAQFAKTMSADGTVLLSHAMDTVLDRETTYYKLDIRDSALLYHEVRALEQLMAKIAELSDGATIVIGVQVLNEPTATMLWGAQEQAVRPPLPEDTRALAAYLDQLAGAVKSGPHVVWTRVNLYVELEGKAAADILIQELDATRVDFVGADLYTREPAEIEAYLTSSTFSVQRGPLMVMENGGHYENTPELIAAALSSSGWHHIWEVCDTMPAWPAGLWGVFDGTLTPKPHTDRVTRFNRALLQVRGELASAVPKGNVWSIGDPHPLSARLAPEGTFPSVVIGSYDHIAVAGIDGVLRVIDDDGVVISTEQGALHVPYGGRIAVDGVVRVVPARGQHDGR